MSEIQIAGHLKIHSGKIEEFKSVVETCMKSVREKDTGTLQYDWFFNADQSECRVHERYRDSAAALEHMANLGDETFGKLFALADFLSVEVYGNPSDQLLKATEGMDLTIYSLFQTI